MNLNVFLYPQSGIRPLFRLFSSFLINVVNESSEKNVGISWNFKVFHTVTQTCFLNMNNFLTHKVGLDLLFEALSFFDIFIKYY